MFEDPGPKNHWGYGFGTRDLKYWVLGPSEFLVLTWLHKIYLALGSSSKYIQLAYEEMVVALGMPLFVRNPPGTTMSTQQRFLFSYRHPATTLERDRSHQRVKAVRPSTGIYARLWAWELLLCRSLEPLPLKRLLFKILKPLRAQHSRTWKARVHLNLGPLLLEASAAWCFGYILKGSALVPFLLVLYRVHAEKIRDAPKGTTSEPLGMYLDASHGMNHLLPITEARHVPDPWTNFKI